MLSYSRYPFLRFYLTPRRSSPCPMTSPTPGPEMNMVNVQGTNSGEDTYMVDFKESLDAIVEITL